VNQKLNKPFYFRPSTFFLAPLESGSAPINASTGSYSYLTQDILGGIRDANFDAGAEEFSANRTHFPYIAANVGETVGFGATIVITPILTILPSTITFGIDEGTFTFDVISNIDWTITENLSWLSLDLTSGSGVTTVTATVSENTTGAERTGNFTVDEVAGGNGLSATLPIQQLNTFLAAEIPIVGTTSLGMQIKDGISEENAYNDDNSNYWTGNPDTAAIVSITFDLSCPHIF